MDAQSLGSASTNTVQDSPAGIHCANPQCRTRAGERSRGHQSCRWLFCGHCCQNAARVAAEAGESRPICKVHARRVHTGHKPIAKVERHSEGIPAALSTAPNNPSPSGPTTVPRTGETEGLDDLLEKRARLEQSLKRSLTMVIWYRNGCEPLRIAHEVTTFPLFQLQDFPELIGELGLQPASYIDAYNNETGQWEQHKISTVRTVEQDQRLLYRLRPSLLDGLTDCPSLDQELSLQPFPKTQAKRQPEPPTLSPPLSKQVRVLSNSTPVRPPAIASSQSISLQNLAASASSASPIQGPSSWSLAPPAGTPLQVHRTNQTTPAPTNTPIDRSSPSNSGNIKRWPTDYSVHEIVEGFDAMASIMKSEPSARQKTAFERVFQPCRYVKSTVGRAKLYWKRASQEIKDHFLSLARDDPRGKWTNFVHLMDGRLVIEVGKENASVGSGVGVGGMGVSIGDESMEAGTGVDTADEDERADTTSPLSFANAAPSNQPQINIQSSQALTAHASLQLTRPPGPPPMGALLPSHPNHPSPLGHHASAPTISMTSPYSLDRNLNMNRSSSSLSGAMAIPEV